MQNILDFGAVADGKTVNTAAIQAAIDAGGTVRIPRGVFVTGTIYLKSNGGLLLESGAVLKPSHSRSDFNADDFCPQNAVFSAESVTGAHLIAAVEQENVFICGEGTIDGDAHYWVNGTNREREGSIVYAPNAERPAQMVVFFECKGVRVRDIHIRNTPYWALFCHGCTEVQIRGLDIQNEPRQFTNDGIDLDCCQRVTVSDCVISAGDDALTLRGNGKRLKSPQSCSDVVVTNCILRSNGGYAIRIGVGNLPIQNCTFSNIRVNGGHSGIGITACFSLHGGVVGTPVRHLRFSDMMIDAYRPIEIRLVSGTNIPQLENPCDITDIRFDRIRAQGIRDNLVLGYPGGECADITFADCDFVQGGTANVTAYLDNCGIWDTATGDSCFLLKACTAVRFDRVRFGLLQKAEGWQYDVSAQNCEAVTFRDCTFSLGKHTT